jgi:outer membrane receptor protein involved in Fe transport
MNGACNGFCRAVGTPSLLALAVSSALASAASAQDAGQDATMSEIMVTATRRSENLQDVPISIQVLDSQLLQQHQVTDLDDYLKLLPSASYQSFGPGQSQLFFRGISSGSDGLHGAQLPTTGTYLDETPISTIGGTVDLHIYDIARVEALAGPQGTLYGASSLAGTLRIITNKPDTHAFAAGYDVEANTYGSGGPGGTVEGFVNIPLSDQVALRLVGFYKHLGGYIDNVPSSRTYTLGQTNPADDLTINNARFVENHFNDVTTYGGRAALKIDLNDNWTVSPSVIAQHQVAHGTFLWDPAEGYLKVNDFTPDGASDRWYQAALTVEGKLGNWDLVYSGGYFDRTLQTQADYSYYTVAYDTVPGFTNFPNGAGGFLDPTQSYTTRDDYTKNTQEIRISSAADQRLRFVTGAFYEKQADAILQQYLIDGLAGIPNSPAIPGFGDNIYLYRAYRVDRDYALFAEPSFDITKSLTLTAGVRGFIADNGLRGFSGTAGSAAAPNCIPIGDPTLPCQNFNGKYYQRGETHKANLTWRIDSDHMLYATYSTGFRPGGVNRIAGVNPYKADTLTNYEVGWKTMWLDRRLRINGAVFIEKWNDLQYALSPLGFAGITNIYNSGNAEVKGVESDVSWRIGGLTLTTSGTYIAAKLTSPFCQIDAAGNDVCTPGTAPTAPEGTPLPIQPKLKINATTRYEFDAATLRPFVQASVSHQGSANSRLSVIEESELGPTKGFTTFDFSTGAIFSNSAVELFIQNAFNQKGELSINTVCSPTICGFRPRIYSIRPQFLGLKFRQRF